MSDHCTYTTSGVACPQLATHFVACSPYAPHAWHVYAEPIEVPPDQHGPIAEFCLQHAGAIAHARYARSHDAVRKKGAPNVLS